ncbi:MULTISPECIES: MarR family transcriptional regulator [unclassified Pseudodesulfovibrio]|uniref:MarR family winged helix-turn-helix transcriptional regulator n=1 Tax=unclassified Pseudodesulfovibrio TaxID=2661612 RepID=UPI000FEBD814|nr:MULTISPECIES: MarR family transcriptional regulator [unclassified Pseudodesulfovibrio]MCJ2166084.1 MarR family transcriptional regulator [Pseudodesulfovibrio sp. S3-i]RWU02436.1 MarR family transcriptional regulator [Pseudodesulfovibrio sp. S3]
MLLERLNPKESMGFLAWKVSRILTNDLAAQFSQAGVKITVEQWRALLPTYSLDGLTQGRLCEMLLQEKTGVSRLVTALEKQGLVRRNASKEDRRVKFIYITEAGRELVDFTLSIVISSRDRLVAHVNPEELAICKRVLWKIVQPYLDAACVSQEEPC